MTFLYATDNSFASSTELFVRARFRGDFGHVFHHFIVPAFVLVVASAQREKLDRSGQRRKKKATHHQGFSSLSFFCQRVVFSKEEKERKMRPRARKNHQDVVFTGRQPQKQLRPRAETVVSRAIRRVSAPRSFRASPSPLESRRAKSSFPLDKKS